jgi:hypothetical protein
MTQTDPVKLLARVAELEKALRLAREELATCCLVFWKPEGKQSALYNGVTDVIEDIDAALAGTGDDVQDGWIEWKGGSWEGDPKTLVSVRLRDGSEDAGLAIEIIDK